MARRCGRRSSRAPSPGWRILAPDLRGFGGSTDERDDGVEPTIDDYADDVAGLVREVVGTPVVLGGLSMGGYAALAVMRRTPALVRALVLADTRAGADSLEGRAGRKAMLTLLEREGPQGVARDMMPKLLGATTREQNADAEETVRRLIKRHSPHGIRDAILRMMERPDSTPLLPTITVPTLVLVGDEDVLTPARRLRGHRQRAAERLAGAHRRRRPPVEPRAPAGLRGQRRRLPGRAPDALTAGMDLGLQGKVAIITGSSRGLGLASARALVAEGCHACISARGQEALAEAALALASASARGAEVLAVAADLATEAGVARVVDATIGRFGGVDVLVNNVALARGGDLLATSDADWQEAFDQTLFPAIRASRLVVPSMRARGGGAIVVISSIFGREAGGRMTYNAVKAAEISLAKSLAQQLARDNIRVNSVSPGSISFPGGSWHKRQQADPEGIAAFIKAELPFGRFGRAEEVGDVVAFLASSRASWISGTSIVVDGCQSRAF